MNSLRSALPSIILLLLIGFSGTSQVNAQSQTVIITVRSDQKLLCPTPDHPDCRLVKIEFKSGTSSKQCASTLSPVRQAYIDPIGLPIKIYKGSYLYWKYPWQENWIQYFPFGDNPEPIIVSYNPLINPDEPRRDICTEGPPPQQPRPCPVDPTTGYRIALVKNPDDLYKWNAIEVLEGTVKLYEDKLGRGRDLTCGDITWEGRGNVAFAVIFGSQDDLLRLYVLRDKWYVFAKSYPGGIFGEKWNGPLHYSLNNVQIWWPRCSRGWFSGNSATFEQDTRRTVFYVDKNYKGSRAMGSSEQPLTNIKSAYECAGRNAKIIIKPGMYPENLRLDKPVTLVADGGTVTIGRE